MPEESAGDRTEDATPRRKEKERERGRVAKSKDLLAATVLLGSMLFLRYGGGFHLYKWLHKAAVRLIQYDMAHVLPPNANEVYPLAMTWLTFTAYAVLPFLIFILVLAIVGGLLQVGFLMSAEPLTPDLNRMNPINGVKRIFGLKSLVMLVMNMSKLAVIVGIAYSFLMSEISAAAGLAQLLPKEMIVYGSTAVADLGIILALVLFILGVFDMAYQVYQFNKDIKMSKQEVKQELKDMEGDPQIRARRRAIQRQMAMQRMMQEVPDAEVVVRNPTHYAVAIKYKPDMNAPIIVAKGVDHMAKRILDVAKKYNIPSWRDPPLARQLYRLEIGDTIPQELFQVLANIIMHVMSPEKRKEFMLEQEKIQNEAA